MKFKVGDKVKIVKERTGEMNEEGDMDEYLGKTMTIVEIRNTWGRESYKMKEDKGEWYWHDDMIEELVQFTKSDLKDGDIVTYRDSVKAVVSENRSKLKTLKYQGLMCLSSYDENLMYLGVTEDDRKYDIIKVERPIQYETVYERKEEILDKAEKRYLRNVIRPFRKEVVSITKMQKYETQFIRIKMLNSFNSNGYLPSFKSETKYKKMEAGKEYTLEELRTIKE